jgi:hypothetical protein
MTTAMHRHIVGKNNIRHIFLKQNLIFEIQILKQ